MKKRLRHRVLSLTVLALCASLAAAGTEPLALLLPFTPPAELNSAEGFSFVVYGDVQGNYRNQHDLLVEQILRDRPSLVFNTGDISPDQGRNYDEEFLRKGKTLAEKVAFFPAVGNHDVDWGSAFSRTPFSLFFRQALDYAGRLPDNGHLLESGSQKLWYSVRYQNALFIVLDSNLFIDEGKYRRTHALSFYQNHAPEQRVWLRDLLEEASGDPGVEFRFVFFHHSPIVSDETGSVPVLGVGGHPGHRRAVLDEKVPSHAPGESMYLLDLFRSHGVTAVFTGHEHYYERWREVIREAGEPIHAVNWLVTGNGGVKPRGRPKVREKDIQRVLNKWYYRHYLERIEDVNTRWKSELLHLYPTPEQPDGRFPGYVLVTVKGGRVSFQTKDADGQVRDSGPLTL